LACIVLDDNSGIVIEFGLYCFRW